MYRSVGWWSSELHSASFNNFSQRKCTSWYVWIESILHPSAKYISICAIEPSDTPITSYHKIVYRINLGINNRLSSNKYFSPVLKLLTLNPYIPTSEYQIRTNGWKFQHEFWVRIFLLPFFVVIFCSFYCTFSASYYP